MKKYFKNGFTLVELLVVIAIISILSMVTLSQFRTAKMKANDVARKGDLNSVAKALQMYFADYGLLPASNLGRIEVVTGDPIEWGGEFADSSGYVYMKVLPTENKPNWPQYCYMVDPTRKKYAVFADLENTIDEECEGHSYTCNGAEYCFAYVSPNSKLNESGELE